MKTFIILISLFIIGCSNIPKRHWNHVNCNDTLYLELQLGDIIIKEKQFSLLGMFGHTGIMKDNRLLVNYPKLGEKIEVIDINYWLEIDRKFMVLRYIGMNEEFKKQLLINLNYYIYINVPYKLTLDKLNDEGFYCSQFIWYLYYKTAQDLGFELNLTDNLIVFPYDFINSRKLYIIH